MKIILVRHGKLDGRGVSVGNLGPKLSPIGRQQARAVADMLKTESFQALYTSTRRRTQETANIIAKTLGLSPIGLEALTEYGVYFRGKEYGPKVNFRTLQEDAVKTIKAIYSKYQEESKIIIVTHAPFIAALIAEAKGKNLIAQLKWKNIFPNWAQLLKSSTISSPTVSNYKSQPAFRKIL